MCNKTLREVVKGMCKGYPNGRAGMAGALGMSENTFNNKLYGKTVVVSLSFLSWRKWKDYQGQLCYLIT